MCVVFVILWTIETVYKSMMTKYIPPLSVFANANNKEKLKVRFKGNSEIQHKVDHYTSVIDDESIPFLFTSPGV